MTSTKHLQIAHVSTVSSLRFSRSAEKIYRERACNNLRIKIGIIQLVFEFGEQIYLFSSSAISITEVGQ